jgi:ER membrane protein SH3
MHLKLLYHSPALITRMLHIMIFLGIMGFLLKLYKPSESNMLFDGGSLVLYMVAVIVYITNILKGLAIVDFGAYGLGIENLNQDQLDDVDTAGYDVETGNSVLGREDNLKVLSASNTILALVLVGVLVLQAGQWYAERSDEKERKKMMEAEEKEKKEKAEAEKGAVKRQTSGKESKKAK